MYVYINKNKFLFWFSVFLFLEFFLIVVLWVSHYKAHNAFDHLKKDNTLSTKISDSWDFWIFLQKSGKSMSSYRLASQYRQYNDSQIIDTIARFFAKENSLNSSGSSSHQSSVSSPVLNTFNTFNTFNTHLQLALASISGLICLTAANIYLFLSLAWNYLLKSNTFNFWKLSLVLLFNIWGFWGCYEWEKELEETDKERLYRKSYFLTNFFLLKLLWKLKNSKHNFRSSSSENLITTKNLYFSPNIKHSFFKHVLNHYWFLKKNVEIDERSHLYEKAPRFFNKKKDEKYILKNINLNIKKGSFNVIIGPNGSGKTTLIKALINLHENIKGEILWNGQEISKINRTSFARKVSYIPQFLNVEHSISIIDFLNFSRYPYKEIEDNSQEQDTEIILNAIKDSGCEKLAHKMIDELSGGQRQKILLTSVLVQESEIIVLDEPTSFLDIKNQHQFLEKLKELHKQGKTIIMILHDLQQSINYADNLIVMKDGEIKASGHPRDIVTPQLLREAFSINCSIHKGSDYMKISNIYAVQ